MKVDEAGADHVARSVDDTVGLQAGNVSPMYRNRIAGNQHGRVKTGATAPVDDQAVFDEKV